MNELKSKALEGVSGRSPRRVELRQAQKARRRQESVAFLRAHARFLLITVLALVLLGGGVLLGQFLTGEESSLGEAGSAPTLSQEGGRGPFDISQAAAGFDLGMVARAKFLSLALPHETGIRSMMLTQDRPEFQEMAAAVAKADKVSEEAPEAGSNARATLTFVTEERQAAVLTLGEGSTFYWQGATYQAAGNLALMVERAGRLLQ